MFNLRRLLALFAAPRTPLDAALRDIAHGRPARALAALDELLARETDDARRAQIANKRGVALVALERRDEARGAFQSALEIVPRHSPALVNLGNLELECERVENAIVYYRQALQADPGSAAAYRHLAIAYRRSGRTGDALNAFARARRLEGRAPPKQTR